MFSSARSLDLICRRAVMPLDGALFLLLRFLPEDVFILCVSLREVVEAEALVRLQFAATLVITLDEKVYAPFDFRWRTLPAAAEILVVFDLELADVLFDLTQIFVNGRHVLRGPPEPPC